MPRAPRRKTSPPDEPILDPYQEMWRKLSPADRLRRSWRLRSRIKNLQAVHDAKSLPKL